MCLFLIFSLSRVVLLLVRQVLHFTPSAVSKKSLVQEHTQVAPVTVGDTLAVLSTGAYNYSMASNYNRIPRPAIVMVNNGKSRVVVKRESYEDIVRNDI